MKKIILCALALALGGASAASAQDYYRDRDNDRQERYDRNRSDDNSYDRDRSRANRFLPQEYRRQRYVFDGWRERGLGKPGPGQAWVRVCDAFILTSWRSGRIAEVHMAGRGRVDNKPRWRLASSLNSCRR